MADQGDNQVEQGKRLLQPALVKILEAVGSRTGRQMAFSKWGEAADKNDSYLLFVKINGRPKSVPVPAEWLEGYLDESSRSATEARLTAKLERLADDSPW